MQSRAIGICTTSDGAGGRAVLQAGHLWEPGTAITVCLLDGPEYHDKVKTYLPIWSQFANLTFSFVDNDPNAFIRVSFTGTPRVYNSIVGMNSAINCQGNGQPTMFLGFDPQHTEDDYRMYVLHEFGHALGLCHEHQSPGSTIEWDRDAVINYYQASNPSWTPQTYEDNIFSKLQFGGKSDSPNATVQNYTEFDPASVMIYSFPDGLAKNFKHLGFNTNLSDQDKKFVGMIYPFDEVELKVVAAPVAGSIAKPGTMTSYRFTVANQGTYQIETTGTTPTSISLMGPDSRGLFIDENHDAGTMMNGMLKTSLSPATYYLKVQHRLIASTGDYQISVRPA